MCFLLFLNRFFSILTYPPSPSENVSLRHIIEGRIAIATPPKPI